MATFSLKIVTPDGLIYDGEAKELVVRTTAGDVGILAGHLDLVAPLGMGQATVILEDSTRRAACIGGMVNVKSGAVTLVPTTFEWADQIDADRTEASYQRAKKVLDSKDSSATELRLAEARLRRALVRKGVAGK